MFGVQKFITEQPGNVNSFLSPPLLCFGNCSQAQVEYQGPVEDKGDHKTLPHPQAIPHLWTMPELTSLAQ